MNKKSICLISIIFIFWLINNSVSSFFPSYVLSLGLGIDFVALIISFLCIIRVVFQPIAGLLLTKNKFQITLCLPMFLLTVATLGYVLTKQYYHLLFCRAIEAVAICLFTIQIRVQIKKLFDQQHIIKINNYYASIKNCASLIGPALAGYIIHNLGYQHLYILLSLLATLGIIITFMLNSDKQKESVFSPTTKEDLKIFFTNIKILQLACIHFFEMVGLGLWLTGWVVYAQKDLAWNTNFIGATLSLSAASGMLVLPLLNRYFKEFLFEKIILGLFFLSIQAFAVIIFKSNIILIICAFIIGGIGGTLYFSSFHSYCANLLTPKLIPLFYGIIGSIGYIGMAAGQILTPYLWKYSSNVAPILVDALLLIMIVIIFISTHLIGKQISPGRIEYE